jgi:hypothetical protein
MVTSILNTWRKNGVKMRNKHYFTLMTLSLILGYFVLKISETNNKNITVKYPERKDVQEQVKYLKDSFNNEYYKKQLETYPFQHSKINYER